MGPADPPIRVRQHHTVPNMENHPMHDDVANLVANTTAEPRPYQIRIIEKTLKALNEDKYRSVMIESATGSGKTYMCLMIAKIQQLKIPDLEIGWISMRRNLLAQAQQENTKHGVNARIHPISMFAKELPDALVRAKNRMIIIDEGQHDCTDSMTSIYKTIKPQYIVGCTATPFRTDYFKLAFDVQIKDAGIGQLITDGYLSPYHHYTIDAYNVQSATKLYADDPQKWGKSIFYFHTLDQCAQAGAILTRKGIKNEVVTGSSDREQQLARFHCGEVDALINCMVLTEGFDSPALKTVFCRPSCKSVTIQMCGRAFRRHEDVPVKQIVQCKKTRWPFIRTARPLVQYIQQQDEWASLTLNPNIAAVSQKVTLAICSIQTEMPRFLLDRKKKRRKKERGQNEGL